MLVEREALLRALGATEMEIEPTSLSGSAPERVRATLAAGKQTFLVRRSQEPELVRNHIAVMEALARLGFVHAPRLAADVAGASVETFVEGLTAMNVDPGGEALSAAVDGLATLHRLPIREGLRWGAPPRTQLPGEDPQLFRLGFTSEERSAAAPWLAASVEALAASRFGFCHGAATADHVVFGAGGPTFVNFERAGFGAQLMDLAAFLATSGADAGLRRDLAERYGATTGLDAGGLVHLVDLATLMWGLDWLLLLPRRLIVNLGDDVASAQLKLAASRVETAAREPAGEHLAAAGLRHALWGG